MKSRQWKKFYRESRAKMESSLNEIVCPIDTEWKFKKADLMDLKDTENGYLNGKYFNAYNIPGIQYFIRIYPNGHNEKHRGQTWIFLYLNGSEKRKADTYVTISIKSANYSEELYKVNVYYDHGYGEEVCKTAEFFEYKSKYFVDGEITIKIKGTLKVKRSSISRISSFISTQWKIRFDDLKEKMNGESNTCLYSEDINFESLSDFKYYLGICPNRIKYEKEAGTYLSLHVKNRKQKKVDAVFSFSVDSANYNYGTQHIFDGSGGPRSPLCSTEDLFDPAKGFIADGFITINFRGVLMIENNRFITLNCKRSPAQKSVVENDDKDFLIIVGEKVIQVHKQVLSDVSPVFAGMLESGMKESIENKMYISDFAFKTVDISIKLCYGNSILLKFSLETLLSIYRFGDKYRIELITDLMEEYLIKEISPSNLVYLIKFSSPDSSSVKKLHQICIEFLIKCVKDSVPVYASESLDKTFVASLVLSSLRPN